ncbi:MAG: tetratricopeptide repeat protein [Deltaproteobacteria bacterium]|nr:tetratricopeptide repeat protein [Deltaproteobacteria bacterium]
MKCRKKTFLFVIFMVLFLVTCNKQKTLVEEGDKLREEGKFDEAIAKYEEAIKINEKSEFASMAKTGLLMAKYNKAEKVEKDGDLQRAFELYDDWLKANPEEDKNKAKAKIVSNAEQAAIRVLSKQMTDESIKQIKFLANIILNYDQSAFKKAVWNALMAFDQRNIEAFINNYKEATEKKPKLMYEPYKLIMDFFDQKVMEMIAAQQGTTEQESQQAVTKKGGKKK